MGDAGTIAVSNALSECKVSKLQELDLSGNGIGPPGGEALGNMLLVHASLTKLDARFNSSMGEEGKAVLRKAVEGESKIGSEHGEIGRSFPRQTEAIRCDEGRVGERSPA